MNAEFIWSGMLPLLLPSLSKLQVGNVLVATPHNLDPVFRDSLILIEGYWPFREDDGVIFGECIIDGHPAASDNLLIKTSRNMPKWKRCQIVGGIVGNLWKILTNV